MINKPNFKPKRWKPKSRRQSFINANAFHINPEICLTAKNPAEMQAERNENKLLKISSNAVDACSKFSHTDVYPKDKPEDEKSTILATLIVIKQLTYW